jgi:hypothetical protein
MSLKADKKKKCCEVPNRKKDISEKHKYFLVNTNIRNTIDFAKQFKGHGWVGD